MAGGWSFGLKAAIQDPSLRVDSDERTVTIKDKYPKAKHHFLILPKDEGLTGLKSLASSHIALIEHMHHRGEALAKSICKGESKGYFRIGYHAVPSMRFLHLHVISQDFDSPCLKTKKHWNSFTSEFFMDSTDVIRKLKTEGKVEVSFPARGKCGAQVVDPFTSTHKTSELSNKTYKIVPCRPGVRGRFRGFATLKASGKKTLEPRVNSAKYETLLKGPLRCHVCQEEQRNIPNLKHHIATCYKNPSHTE